jgi:hypothetical protein
VVIGGKETHDRIAGEAGDSLKTVDDRGGGALVGRLNNQPRRWHAGQLVTVKPLMSLYDRIDSLFRGNCCSEPGPCLSQECFASVEAAKLLWPVFTGDRPG